MKRLLGMAVMMCALVALAGCGGGEEKLPTDAPPPPPEPTAQEISGALSQAVQPVVQAAESGRSVAPEEGQAAAAQLRSAKSQYTGKQHLQEAMSSVAAQVERAVDASMKAEAWTTTMAAVDLLTELNPRSSRIESAKQRAQREINRPKITKRPGYAVSDDVTTVLLEVNFPETGKTENYRVRVGDEFADGKMRLDEVVGRNQGIVVVYTDDGKEVRIMNRERE